MASAKQMGKADDAMDAESCKSKKSFGKDDSKDADKKKKPNPFAKGDDGDDEEDDEDEDMSKKAKKSLDDDGLSIDQLRKSLRALKSFTNENDPTSRKDQLLSKAQGGNLDDDERNELYSLLGDAPQRRSAVELTKSMSSNETLQKSLDVSDYLKEQNSEVVGALDKVGEHLERSQSVQNDFNVVLAKSLAHVGSVLLQAEARLARLEGQPVRGPKSAGVTALNKGFAGQAPAPAGMPEGGLNKSQTLAVITELNRLSYESKEPDMHGMTKGGEEWRLVASKYESTNQLSKSAQGEIVQFMQQQNRAR